MWNGLGELHFANTGPNFFNVFGLAAVSKLHLYPICSIGQAFAKQFIYRG